MRKLNTLAAIALATTSLSGAPDAAHAQTAGAVIDRAAAAYARLNSMRAEFTQTLTNPLTGSTQTTSGVILRKKPNFLSINFESGDRVAADGSTLWVYLPSSTPGQVIKMPYTGANASSLDPADQFLNSPRTRFTVTSAGTATIGGRPTHAVTLIPKRASTEFKSAKVWIDDADSSVRQFDVENASGMTRHVVITSFTANPTLSNASFKFVPPKGARIVDQAAAAGY